MELADIEQLMASPDPQERKQAVLRLAELSPALGAPRLTSLLIDPNQAVSETAQVNLMMLGGPATVQALIPLLGSPAASQRNAAIEILRNIGQDDLEALQVLTHDANAHVRIFSVDILGSIASPDSLETLCACLADANPNVRNAALVALGQVGDPRALQCMRRLIDDDEWIRFTLIEALAKLGGQEAAAFLVAELERWRADELTLGAIIETLGLLGEPVSCAPLLELLPTAGGFVGLNLVRALGRLLGPRGLRALSAPQREQIRLIIESQLLNEDQQLDLLEILASVDARQSAGILLELARRLDPQVDDERLQALKRTMVALDLKPTAAAMLGAEDHLKVLGAEILGLTGGHEADLIAALGQTRGEARRSLAQALTRSAAPMAGACLKGLIADADGHVAATALRAAATWVADAADLDQLGAYLEHAYPDVRAAALDGICSLDKAAAERLLLSRLGEQPELSPLALEGLARLNSRRLAPLLAEVLPRQPLAVLGLIRDHDLEIAPALLAELLETAGAPVRQLVMEIIGRQGLNELRPQLEAELNSSDRRSAYQAILALGRFPDARGVLLESLRQGPDLLKLAVFKAFGDWRDPDLAEELEAYLEDDNPDVAHACARLLEKMNGA